MHEHYEGNRPTNGTTLTPVIGNLTMDDLERLAFTHGGVIEPVGDHKARLVGAFIGGRLVTLGPVLVAPRSVKLGSAGGVRA